jgi:hypothetical protein
MVILDEIIRSIMPSRFAAFSVILYAAVLIIMAMLKPGGLIAFFTKKSPGADIGKSLLEAIRIHPKSASRKEA